MGVVGFEGTRRSAAQGWIHSVKCGPLLERQAHLPQVSLIHVILRTEEGLASALWEPIADALVNYSKPLGVVQRACQQHTASQGANWGQLSSATVIHHTVVCVALEGPPGLQSPFGKGLEDWRGKGEPLTLDARLLEYVRKALANVFSYICCVPQHVQLHTGAGRFFRDFRQKKTQGL